MAEDNISTVMPTIRDVLDSFSKQNFSSEQNFLNKLKQKRMRYGDRLEKQNEGEARFLRKVKLVSKVVNVLSIGGLCLGAVIAPGIVDGFTEEQMQHFTVHVAPNILKFVLAAGSIGVIGIGTSIAVKSSLNKIRDNVDNEVKAIDDESRYFDRRKSHVQAFLSGNGISNIDKRILASRTATEGDSHMLRAILMHSRIDISSVLQVFYSDSKLFQSLYKVVEDTYKTKLSQNFILGDEQTEQYEKATSIITSQGMETATKKFIIEQERIKKEQTRYVRPQGRYIGYGGVGHPQNLNIRATAGSALVTPVTLNKGTTGKTQMVPMPNYVIIGPENDDNPLNRKGNGKSVRPIGKEPNFDNPLYHLGEENIALENIKSGRPIFDGIPTLDDIRKSLPSESETLSEAYRASAFDNLQEGRPITEGIPIDGGQSIYSGRSRK